MKVFKLTDEDEERYYVVARDIPHAHEVLRRWEPDAEAIVEETELSDEELHMYHVTSDEFEENECPTMYELLQDYTDESEGDIIASTLYS